MESEKANYIIAARVLLADSPKVVLKMGPKEEVFSTQSLGDDWFLARVCFPKKAVKKYAGELKLKIVLTSKQNGRYVYVEYRTCDLEVMDCDTIVTVDVDGRPVYTKMPYAWNDDRAIITDLKGINGLPVDVALGPRIVIGSRAVCLLDPLMAFYMRRYSKFQCIPKVYLGGTFMAFCDHYMEIVADAKLKEEQERLKVLKAAKNQKKGLFARIRGLFRKKKC